VFYPYSSTIMTCESVKDFIAELRTYSADTPVPAYLDVIRELLGRNIRYQVHHQPGLKTNIGATPMYLSLHVNKNHSHFSRSIDSDSNGLLLCWGTWEIIVMPLRAFNPSPSLRSRVVKRYLNHYDVYYADDGTVANLYFDRDEWRMSTANGYDVGKFNCGRSRDRDITYMDAFTEIASKYPDFSFDKLNKKFCYSVGFRHHSIQPLMVDPQRAWFIRGFNIEKMEEDLTSIGLPPQRPAKVGGVLATDLRPKGTSILTELTSKTIYDANFNAYDNFNKSGAIHYGFIFRSRDGYSDIFIESDLMKKIRTLYYNPPREIAALSEKLTPKARACYMTLRAYLGHDKAQFAKLFPHLAIRFTEYDLAISGVIRKARQMLASNCLDTAEPTPLDNLASWLAGSTITAGGCNTSSADCESILRDFIVSPENLNMLHQYLNY